MSRLIEVRPGDHMMDALRYGVIEVQKRRPKPRILWTLFRLWRAWRKCPYMRLGQLIDNAMWIDDHGPDLFNIYDESLINRIEAFERRTL